MPGRPPANAAVARLAQGGRTMNHVGNAREERAGPAWRTTRGGRQWRGDDEFRVSPDSKHMNVPLDRVGPLRTAPVVAKATHLRIHICEFIGAMGCDVKMERLLRAWPRTTRMTLRCSPNSSAECCTRIVCSEQGTAQAPRADKVHAVCWCSGRSPTTGEGWSHSTRSPSGSCTDHRMNVISAML